MGVDCGFCGKPANKTCGKCKNISYCSRECQISDWKIHKTICVQIVAKKRVKEVPVTPSFPSNNLIGSVEDEEIAAWIIAQELPNILNFKILVKNFSNKPIRLSPKTVLLTIKGQPIRKKVLLSPPEHSSKIIEINQLENKDNLDQISLETNGFGVISVFFNSDEHSSLKDCEFIEVPVKAEGKGMVKLKIPFSQQQIVDNNVQQNSATNGRITVD